MVSVEGSVLVVKKTIRRWLVLVAVCFCLPLNAFSQSDVAPATAAQAKQQIEDAKAQVKAAEDDLIRLESTFVGDKEQPAVSYFIPWQGTSSPDNLRWQIERKNDDTLNLVDRDIMLRSMNIYNEMQLEAPSVR